jgi:hypothetical protein
MGLGGRGWSQVATAHLSHGLVICSALLAAYLLASAVAAVLERRDRARGEAVRAVVFLAALPLLSLAIIVPHIDAIETSSLAAGYDRLGDAIGTLGGSDGRSIQANGVWAAWPLAFGATPGAYAGGVILLGVPLALRARRFRALTWAFGGAVVITWVLMLDAVVTAQWIRDVLLRIPFGDVYLHNPGRMRYLAVIAVPVLGAVGIQGLRDHPLSAKAAIRWLCAGAFFWLGVPLLALANPLRFLVLAAALALGGWALFELSARRRPRAWIAVGAVLSVELVAGAVYSQLIAPAPRSSSTWKPASIRT